MGIGGWGELSFGLSLCLFFCFVFQAQRDSACQSCHEHPCFCGVLFFRPCVPVLCVCLSVRLCMTVHDHEGILRSVYVIGINLRSFPPRHFLLLPHVRLSMTVHDDFLSLAHVHSTMTSPSASSRILNRASCATLSQSIATNPRRADFEMFGVTI